jgi:hypothetical protein
VNHHDETDHDEIRANQAYIDDENRSEAGYPHRLAALTDQLTIIERHLADARTVIATAAGRDRVEDAETNLVDLKHIAKTIATTAIDILTLLADDAPNL